MISKQFKAKDKKARLPFKFQHGLHILFICLILTVVFSVFFLLKFKTHSISQNPRDWESFYTVVISFLILIATISIAYFVKKASENNSSHPLKYKAYLDFMDDISEINDFFAKEFQFVTELEIILNQLTLLEKKFYGFQVKNGFLFGLKYTKEALKQKDALNTIIEVGQAYSNQEKVNESDFVKLKRKVEYLYAGIISSLQYSLVGYYIRIR